MRDPYPSETKDRFMVRLPDGMREKIKAASQAANRTMNAEIVARLEASFADTGDERSRLAANRVLSMRLTEKADPIVARILDLERRISKLEG